MSDEELINKATDKIKRGLQNWEQLNDEEQGKLAHTMVLTAIIKNWDETWDTFALILQAHAEGTCPKCKQPAATGLPDCIVCETMRKVKENIK